MFNAASTPEMYTGEGPLSLHDALPIYEQDQNPEMMKKLEDALIVVEDKEDVEAAENAKKEIVDEFEFSEHEDQGNTENLTQPPKQKRKEESEFKKNEIIDWENDDTLLSITKKSLQFYQSQ